MTDDELHDWITRMIKAEGVADLRARQMAKTIIYYVRNPEPPEPPREDGMAVYRDGKWHYS